MRRLDGKFSIDGDEIIKTSNGEKIPHDEPTFLIRGRDWLALKGLRAYRQISIQDQCNDFHIGGIDDAIEAFEEFARAYPERMKQPGITRGR
jgi:hypothetical protein